MGDADALVRPRRVHAEEGALKKYDHREVRLWAGFLVFEVEERNLVDD